MSEARFEESEEISHFQSFSIVGRALRYVGPFKARFAVKLLLVAISIVPFLFLPFPIKVVIDHVIGGVPIGQEVTPYPFFLQPAIDFLADKSRLEILLWAAFGQFMVLILLGSIGTSGRERDVAEGTLAQGQDTATQSENEANSGYSLMGGLLGLFEYRWTIRLSQDLNHYYRSQLFERIQTLPMRAFDDERIGDAIYRMMYDTPTITTVCLRLLTTPITAPLTILVYIWMMTLLYGSHPVIVWSAVSFLPIVLVVTFPFAAALRRRSERSRKAGATTTSSVEEGVTNILAVQSLGGETRERNRFEGDSEESFGKFRGLLLVGMGAIFVTAIALLYVVALVFLEVGGAIIDGTISVGDFAVLLPYFYVIALSALAIGDLWIRLQEKTAGLNRVFFLMDAPSEQDPPGAAALRPVREGVELENVDFAYEAGTPALRNVSFEARIGEITAFAGPAGAGKTTLAYLIPRFLSPDSGRVLIDGVDTAEVTQDSLRSQVAFVFQETVLFDATIEENIRMAKPDATDLEIRRAAEVAGAAEFIARLPEGYQTALGRSGSKLSVGQRQRLSIARALVRDAPILILDEPTSALDPETEQRLVRALREASRTRIVIVIAHRLSTIRESDRILFLQDGEIVERGSHVELIAQPGGAYRRFVELQTRGAA